MEALLVGFSLLYPGNWSWEFMSIMLAVVGGCLIGDIIGEILFTRHGGVTKTRIIIWLIAALVCIYGIGQVSILSAGVF